MHEHMQCTYYAHFSTHPRLHIISAMLGIGGSSVLHQSTDVNQLISRMLYSTASYAKTAVYPLPSNMQHRFRLRGLDNLWLQNEHTYSILRFRAEYLQFNQQVAQLSRVASRDIDVLRQREVITTTADPLRLLPTRLQHKNLPSCRGIRSQRVQNGPTKNVQAYIYYAQSRAQLVRIGAQWLTLRPRAHAS